MIKVLLFGALAAVMGFLLSEWGFRGKRLFSILCIVLILSASAEGLGELFGFTAELSEAADTGGAVTCAFKLVGASYLFGICSDMASELGEGGVANALSLAYKVEAALLVLPYLRELTSAALALLNKIQ